MSFKVKVWNDDLSAYSEDWRGKTITIPPKECVEMGFEDAVVFRGSYPGKGITKMIRIEEPKNASVSVVPTCMRCGMRFMHEGELITHLDQAHGIKQTQLVEKTKEVVEKVVTRKVYLCPKCEDEFSEIEKLEQHVAENHKTLSRVIGLKGKKQNDSRASAIDDKAAIN
jgi:uncharacterized C2H2 Zn-finger protein